MRPAIKSLPLAFALAVALGATAPTAVNADTESDALSQLSDPVITDQTLGKLVGVWNGDGSVRRGSDRQVEAVKCRLTNDWAAEGKLLKMQLACRGVDYRFNATSHLGRTGGKYVGAISSSRGDRGMMAGRGSGSRLSLAVRSTGPGGEGTGSLEMAISGGQLSNVLTRTDPKTGQQYTALDVTMTQ